jgi:hypothetical protein
MVTGGCHHRKETAMRLIRVALAWLLITAIATPAIAGDLRESITKAGTEQTPTRSGSIPKPYLWTGTSLFVGGMAVGLYGFLNNKNGEFPEFGEADSTNRALGTAGLVTAFIGGTILFLGERRASPSVTFSPGRMSVTKTVKF